MFGLRRMFIDNFLGGAREKTTDRLVQQEEKEVKIYAPGTQIPYDVSLVPRLKNDHEQLLHLFTHVVQSAQDGEFHRVKPLMDKFLQVLNAHLLLEYTKLYIYLDYSFKLDEYNHTLICDFRREMTQIGRAVRSFYNKWMERRIGPETQSFFLGEAKQIANVLVRRIKTEEERLYEIYDMSPGILLGNAAPFIHSPMVVD